MHGFQINFEYTIEEHLDLAKNLVPNIWFDHFTKQGATLAAIRLVTLSRFNSRYKLFKVYISVQSLLKWTSL